MGAGRRVGTPAWLWGVQGRWLAALTACGAPAAGFFPSAAVLALPASPAQPSLLPPFPTCSCNTRTTAATRSTTAAARAWSGTSQRHAAAGCPRCSAAAVLVPACAATASAAATAATAAAAAAASACLERATRGLTQLLSRAQVLAPPPPGVYGRCRGQRAEASAAELQRLRAELPALPSLDALGMPMSKQLASAWAQWPGAQAAACRQQAASHCRRRRRCYGCFCCVSCARLGWGHSA